jgi:hypothetical protein
VTMLLPGSKKRKVAFIQYSECQETKTAIEHYSECGEAATGINVPNCPEVDKAIDC